MHLSNKVSYKTLGAAAAVVVYLASSGASYAHCKWNHPGHCLGGAVDEIGDLGEDLLDFGEDAFEGGRDILDEAANDTIHIVNEIGEEFETFICDIVGKEPGDGCNVSAGIQIDSTKPPVLTDGEGVPSELPPAATEFDVLAWTRRMEMEDYFYDLEQWNTNPYQIGFTVGLGSIFGDETPHYGWIAKRYFDGQMPWNPTKSGEIRVNDDGGWGLVGARRFDNEGAARLHTGTDYLTAPGEDILAPVDGTVISANKMGNGLSIIVIQLRSGAEAKILYATPRVTVGRKVRREDVIGSAEDIHIVGGYPQTVKNHIHVEYSNGDLSHGRWPRIYFSPDGEYFLVGDRSFLAGACKDRRCFAPSSE
ncbi:M23 family metallopeptidase [Salipiger aestuarii]|uniref:M23 family metallopeptidase n=1 Tax=Salipiger aestuarii TaxID=568098 RepID=UPI0012396E01|nr:M23 family metallopeptidase [Salipiger aestuarii]